MHRAAGVLAVLGSVMIGMPLVMAGSASADAVSPRASTPRLHMSVAASPRMIQSVSHLGQGVLSKATTGARAASVSPVPSYLPACYGDSRNMATVGGALDPASFGAFYNCSQQEWTFEVQTADAWAPSALGDWVVGINVDGNINNNCGGWEDAALVAQTGTPGQFVEEIGTVDSSCNFVPLYQSLSFVITSNSVAISLPWSTIGDSSSLAWSGLLQTRAEEEAAAPGDVVPSLDFVDDRLMGGVYESVPPPTPLNCSTSAAGSTEVVKTGNSERAAAVLRRSGFAGVHDYGEGVVSFSGSAAPAQSALAAAGLTAQVSPEHLYHTENIAAPQTGTTTAPNDPQYSSQWNLPAINASGAWAVTTGNNIVVADVDTGVDYTHEDLPSPQLVPGIDETTATPTVINDASGNTDTNGHGTAVAGVIAASTNNGKGLASLGWHTSVMPVKASTDGSFTSAAIAAGIMYAADNGARVINLSLGGPCPDPTMQSAIEYAQGKGVLVVAAAGNEALFPAVDPEGDYDYPSYPAAYPGVVAVGATGQDGYRAAYSDTGSYVALVAPGGGGDSTTDAVPVLQAGGGYTAELGTSFAAPQVAAAAALILSVNPNLTPNEVTELLTGSATGLGPPGDNIEYGAGILNASAALNDTPPTTAGFGTYTSLVPARILDTRKGIGAPQAKVGPGQSINLTVDGAGGIPASGVAAVVLNVAVTNTTAPSFVTVWPTGQPRPNSSNINFLANQTVPNLVTVKVGSSGRVSLFNASGSTDVIADVAGYYGDGTGAAGSTYVPLTPFRLLDTRKVPAGPVVAGAPRSLPITGVDGVPASATGVVLNVTVTGATAPSFLTVYPDQTTAPVVSNLNYGPGQTVPNLVNAKLGADGAVSIANAAGSVQVIVDLEGYFTASGDTSGSRFFPVVNHRILDTRSNIGGYYTPVGPNASIPVTVVGQGGVLDGAAAAVMNTSVTGPTAPSFLTVYPDGVGRPNAANLNFGASQTIANLVSATIGGDGEVDIYNNQGSVNTIADVVGWYGPAGT